MGKTEKAYARGDLLEKRRAVIEVWSRYCSTPPQEMGKVVMLAGVAPKSTKMGRPPRHPGQARLL